MGFWRPKGNGGQEREPLSSPDATPASAIPDAASSGGAAAANAVGPGLGAATRAAATGPAGKPATAVPLPVTQPPPPEPGVVLVPGVVPPPPVQGVMHATRMGPLTGIAAPGGGYRPTRLSREVGHLLASLGQTRSEVAAALEAAGVRATPRDTPLTPVALFLCAVIGADPNVKSVTVDGCSVVVELRAWWRPDVVVDLPSVIHDFLVAFDECCYPALLAPDRYPGHRPDRPPGHRPDRPPGHRPD
jgi:hypothetical protein